MLKNVIALLSGLYVLLRGPSTVTTVETDTVYRRKHPSDNSKEGLSTPNRIQLVCRQYKHIVKYQRWFMPSKVHYSYAVDVTIFGIGDKQQVLPTYFFPQLCSKLFVNTFFPHACAIEACLSEIMETHKDTL